MGVKRTYTSQDKERTLYATGLVQCNTCGKRETLSDDGSDILHINDTLLDEERPLSEFGECDVCGRTNWVVYAEHAVIGFKLAYPYVHDDRKKNKRALFSVEELLSHINSLEEALRIAQENGFRTHSVIVEDAKLVLWKSLR